MQKAFSDFEKRNGERKNSFQSDRRVFAARGNALAAPPRFGIGIVLVTADSLHEAKTQINFKQKQKKRRQSNKAPMRFRYEQNRGGNRPRNKKRQSGKFCRHLPFFRFRPVQYPRVYDFFKRFLPFVLLPKVFYFCIHFYFLESAKLMHPAFLGIS